MKRLRISVLFLLVAAAFATGAEDNTIQHQLARADQLNRAQQYEDATRVLKELASTPAGQKSYAAHLELAKAFRSIGAYDMCVETAAKAAELAADDLQRSEAHLHAGLCYAEKRGEDDSYTKAENELRSALQLVPENYGVHVSLGSVLMRQHRDEEGIAEMKLYLQKRPTGPLAETAQGLIRYPALARLLFMPEFKITTFDGKSISSADLAGKTVLIDFWAPWCAPCRAALPHLRSLLKEYPPESLAVVSVCGDEKEDTWRNFIYENAMDWPQYYDRYATMRRLFNVKNYPTYFIVDSNGIIRTKVIGVGPEQIVAVEDAVKKEIEGRKALQPKTAPAPAPRQPGTDPKPSNE